jgi:hypothetical protein
MCICLQVREKKRESLSQIYNTSYYDPHLFNLDPIATAIQFLSFDLIILSILRRFMAYASSFQNNLDSFLAEIFIFL